MNRREFIVGGAVAPAGAAEPFVPDVRSLAFPACHQNILSARRCIEAAQAHLILAAEAVDEVTKTNHLVASHTNSEAARSYLGFFFDEYDDVRRERVARGVHRHTKRIDSLPRAEVQRILKGVRA